MKTVSLYDELKNNTYPGRGIVIGKTPDGKNAITAYFIMGRSENSRNRVFTEKDGGIITEAFDPSKLEDPSLIIYAPVRVKNNITIVTNGDQTDTIYDALTDEKTFEDALRTREFEPDGPNWTPRISGMLDIKNNDFTYKLSILKSANGNGDSCERFFYEYSMPINGEGRFIHTYKCDGDPIPSFEGDPEAIATENDIKEFSNKIWENLNPDNKVSLFVRYISLENGSVKTRIYNKNGNTVIED